MTCRTTPLGSAMTSYVKILEGVEEYQSLSLYHEEIRDMPGGLPAPTREQVNEFVDMMIAKVHTSENFTQARKNSLIDRLERSRGTGVSAEIFYASQRIENRAQVAKVALDDYYSNTARDLGESVSQVRARLSASYEESRRERSMSAPSEWVNEYRRRPGNAGLPLDRHTAYAMWRMDNEITERTTVVDSRPTVTNHVRVQGAGVSAVGYNAETGRMEVEFRSRQGQFYAFRDVPADVHAEIVGSGTPTRAFNALVRGNTEYAYTSGHEADAAAVLNQCPTCGQFAGNGHGCPARGSDEEIAATTERARVQQRVIRARAAVASGTVEERTLNYIAGGLSSADARTRALAEDELAGTSPDTTMRHRRAQRLSARLHPYRGDSGTFRCTALSTVRRIAGEEPEVNVPVSAVITRVYDELNQEAVNVPPGTVSGRAIVRPEGFGYTVSSASPMGTSDGEGLKCTCVDYRRNYDCVHVRQLLGDMNRRINQDILSQRHAITDAVAAANTEAHAQYEASVVEQGTSAEQWAAGSDGVAYSGAEGARAFQEDYDAAKARLAAGEDPIPYLRENATDGLGSPEGGRGFGVEMEFAFDPNMTYPQKALALEAIGRELHEAGLTRSAQQQRYHASQDSGYTSVHQGGWVFERDGSVEGELVSPIMYDTPETWENIEKVCGIFARHGARADTRVGSHVHISTGNYDHTVANHNRLIGMFNEHEDDMYRLATQPERGQHRSTQGSGYTSPNPHNSRGYTSLGDVRTNNFGYRALNFRHSASGGESDHVEFRVWDGSLKPSVIQSQIKMSLAMTEAAFRDTDYTPTGHTPVGTSRAANRTERGNARRLTGDDWRASTERTRELADRLFRRREDKAQMAALFAATKWQTSVR
jgi:hypothetical protein